MRLLFERGFTPTHAFRPSIAGCARTSAPTRCCTSAPTARWSSCPASRWACPGVLAGPADRRPAELCTCTRRTIPSEGTIAKRRAAATLISYLTPPIARAGLYRGPAGPEGVDRALARHEPGDDETDERNELATLIQGAGRGPGLELARRSRPELDASVGRRSTKLRRRSDGARVHADPLRPARGRRGRRSRGAADLLLAEAESRTRPDPGPQALAALIAGKPREGPGRRRWRLPERRQPAVIARPARTTG
jgi:magnesium chelatase subunit H